MKNLILCLVLIGIIGCKKEEGVNKDLPSAALKLAVKEFNGDQARLEGALESFRVSSPPEDPSELILYNELVGCELTQTDLETTIGGSQCPLDYSYKSVEESESVSTDSTEYNATNGSFLNLARIGQFFSKSRAELSDTQIKLDQSLLIYHQKHGEVSFNINTVLTVESEQLFDLDIASLIKLGGETIDIGVHLKAAKKDDELIITAQACSLNKVTVNCEEVFDLFGHAPSSFPGVQKAFVIYSRK